MRYRDTSKSSGKNNHPNEYIHRTHYETQANKNSVTESMRRSLKQTKFTSKQDEFKNYIDRNGPIQIFNHNAFSLSGDPNEGSTGNEDLEEVKS